MYALYLLCFLLVGTYGKPWQQDEGSNPIFDGNSDAVPEGEQSALVPSGPAPAEEFGAGPGEGGLDDAAFPGVPQGDAGSGGASYNVFFPIQFKTSRGHHRSADDDGTDSGSYNAIANSFATGRRGIATSHATALGGSSDIPARFNNLQQRPDQQAEAKK
ncbi:unnamed protein product [Callosobruchus maculatus]|uniref:Uncharacterized protein n=1 Tax=Callosobruchus maculatus TaxID=64391 RepID=A0A653CXL6_CALMS|nr:unnamed protein product [Callosobruchus maculatus]